MSLALPVWLLFMTVLFFVVPIMIGFFVYNDATSRGMNGGLWTLIAVLLPAAIGLIIYLVARSTINSYERPSCDGLAPSDTKAPALANRRDAGTWKILITVSVIPVLTIAVLLIGLANFRSSDTSSIESVDGMRIEDFSSNKQVSDWLKNCNQAGDGIYVLEYQYPQDSTSAKRSNYIVYRSGLTKDVSVSVSLGSKGLFNKTWKVQYDDSEKESPLGYHLYQVDYHSTGNTVLEVYVNGKKTAYHVTQSNDPLLFVAPVPWRNDAANLYRLRLEYLGDNSGVIRLISELGLAELGEYKIELKTAQKPYGLLITYPSPIDKFETYDFTPDAIKLLGLIKNVDVVEITNGTTRYKLTADEASASLGHDVKDLGTNQEKLEEYLKTLYESYED